MHRLPGSGTSTSSTSIEKSGPSLTTTPAKHFFGITTWVVSLEIIMMERFDGLRGIETEVFCYYQML